MAPDLFFPPVYYLQRFSWKQEKMFRILEGVPQGCSTVEFTRAYALYEYSEGNGKSGRKSGVNFPTFHFRLCTYPRVSPSFNVIENTTYPASDAAWGPT